MKENKRNKKIGIMIFFDWWFSKDSFPLLISIKEKYGDDADIFIGTDSATIEKLGSKFDSLNINYKNVSKDLNGVDSFKSVSKRISIFTIGRVIMYELFPELLDYETVIYLDSDTFLNKKIPSYYLESKNNFAFLEADKKYDDFLSAFRSFFGSLEKEVFNYLDKKAVERNYFNAGVLIINDNISYRNLCQKIINSKIKADDQTLLNYFNEGEIICDDNILMNNQITREFKKDAIIYHFTTSKKPFFVHSLLEQKGKYLKLVRKTGYIEYVHKSFKYIN